MVQFVGNDIFYLLLGGHQFAFEDIRVLQSRLFDLCNQLHTVGTFDRLLRCRQLPEEICLQLLEAGQDVFVTGGVVVEDSQSHGVKVDKHTGRNGGFRCQIPCHRIHSRIKALKFPDAVKGDEGEQKQNENRCYQEFSAYTKPAFNEF